jgi:hydroxymethylpyrimidine pyrophosphatase-like HAD family hydrolase
VQLSIEDADRAVAMLREQGFTATRSSVHVNFGPPEFDKLSACRQVIEKVLGKDPDDLSRFVYVGDSLNDSTMFAGFDKSVGVANVRQWWDELDEKPKFITASAEGAGLREVVSRILAIVGA